MISDEILEDITRGDYHCLICEESIDYRSTIWSCRSCYRVYDLKCISKWHKKSIAERGSWFCPHCRTPQHKPVGTYKCWCGKTKHPDQDPLHPHSCGQTCGHRGGKQCPHPCTSMCHPGPHRTCTALGPRVQCYCRKSHRQDLCVATSYGGFSCAAKCGKTKKCGVHQCSKKCHKGSCGDCKIKIEVSCYCGKSNLKLDCSAIAKLQKQGQDPQAGMVACGEICKEMLDCGFHACNRACHPRSGEVGIDHKCADKPLPNETCFCGSKRVASILGRERRDCREDRPSCAGICGATLACGHNCKEVCHDGPCRPCEEVVSTRCRCQATTVRTKCGEQPVCTKKCSALRSCRKHKCEVVCCEFSKSGHARGSAQKRPRTLEAYLAQVSIGNATNEADLSEAETAAHLCTESCGRTLSCGLHKCALTCHQGQCPPCLQSDSDDYSCPCGSTVLLAPIRCGTKLPVCTSRCHRPQICGHKAVHLCHSDSDSCPPCTSIVKAPCVCGKELLARPCSSTVVSQCLHPCDKVLDCGHACGRRCHSGECGPCQSQCLTGLSCRYGHRHMVPCHGKSSCGECQTVMSARCPCSNLRVNYVCGEELEVFCNDTCLNREGPYDLFLVQMHLSDLKWTMQTERKLREFVQSDAKSLLFKAMRRSKRKFVHHLAEHMGLSSESQDWGPNRSVCVRRTDQTWLPKNTVGRAVELARLHDGVIPGYLDLDTLSDASD